MPLIKYEKAEKICEFGLKFNKPLLNQFDNINSKAEFNKLFQGL